MGGIRVWCLNNHIPALQPLFIQFIIRQQLVAVCFRCVLALATPNEARRRGREEMEVSGDLINCEHLLHLPGEQLQSLLGFFESSSSPNLRNRVSAVLRSPLCVVSAHISPYFMKTSIFYEEFALCNILC